MTAILLRHNPETGTGRLVQNFDPGYHPGKIGREGAIPFLTDEADDGVQTLHTAGPGWLVELRGTGPDKSLSSLSRRKRIHPPPRDRRVPGVWHGPAPRRCSCRRNPPALRLAHLQRAGK